MHLGCSRRNSITEGMIPRFIHLVIWAHEHESIPQVFECQENQVHFLQPGSSVATSLIQAESKNKHCFFMQVHKTAFKINAIKLQNVRPFVFDHLELNKIAPRLDPRDIKLIEDYLIQRIEKLLAQIEEDRKMKPAELSLPLVRLKIENTGYAVIKSKRPNDHVINKIANLQDFLQFYKRTGFGFGANKFKTERHAQNMSGANGLNPLSGAPGSSNYDPT